MLSQKKKQEVQQQLKNLKNDVYRRWLADLDKAEASGGISEVIMQEGNWLLAKGIVDTFCRDRPYSPLSKTTKEEFDNLYLYI